MNYVRVAVVSSAVSDVSSESNAFYLISSCAKSSLGICLRRLWNDKNDSEANFREDGKKEIPGDYDVIVMAR